MAEFKDIMRKISHTPVYLLNTYQDFVIRSDPERSKFFAKAKGKEEYEIEGNTNLVTDTILEGNEITKSEYEKY